MIRICEFFNESNRLYVATKMLRIKIAFVTKKQISTKNTKQVDAYILQVLDSPAADLIRDLDEIVKFVQFYEPSFEIEVY